MGGRLTRLTHNSQKLARPRNPFPPHRSPVPLLPHLQILSQTGKTSHIPQTPRSALTIPEGPHPHPPRPYNASLSSNTNGATSWSAIFWDYPHARTLGGNSVSLPIPAWTTSCVRRCLLNNYAPKASTSRTWAATLFRFAEPLTFSLSFLVSPADRERHTASRTQGTLHAHMLYFPCKCEDECNGRFLVSVGDDTSHPYGIHGQRIGVALYHPPSETPG
jgi:hypothetical protein